MVVGIRFPEYGPMQMEYHLHQWMEMVRASFLTLREAQ